MNPSRLGLAATLAAGVLLGGGCGYHLAGMGTTLPEHIRVIAVMPFENRTTRPEIEQRVTEEVARELNRRSRYRVGDTSNSDAVLSGAVSSYRTTPVAFTSSGRATRVEAVVTIQASLRDKTDDRLLWSQSGLIFKEQYDVPSEGEFIDLESVALDEIAVGVASVLITSILEGF